LSNGMKALQAAANGNKQLTNGGEL